MPEVLMPRLSDTMAEGVLSLWLKKEGDQVHKGDVLAEIETDKATMELEAYDDGVLTRLLVPEGTTVPIGQPIAVIGGGSEVGSAAPPTTTTSADSAPAAVTTPPAPPSAQPPAPPPVGSPPPGPSGAADTRPRTSPLARAIARDHDIDLAAVVGSGPGGRIVRADVEAAITAAETQPPAPPSQPTARTAPQADAARAAAPAGVQTDVEEVPLTTIRRVTARRLTESVAVPHFFLTSVVEADPLLAFRTEVNEQLAPDGPKVSVTDLLVRACAVTLQAHPQVNSSWGGDKILRHHRIHVGIAVAIDDGLIVPVVRDADRKRLGEIAAETRELAQRARAGRLTPDEFTGGTFTISNLGMFGIDSFTAVINPPEAAILAVGAATEEAVIRGGQVVDRTTIKLTLTVDHRVLDGATAAAFLRDLKNTIEEPLRIVV